MPSRAADGRHACSPSIFANDRSRTLPRGQIIAGRGHREKLGGTLAGWDSSVLHRGRVLSVPDASPLPLIRRQISGPRVRLEGRRLCNQRVHSAARRVSGLSGFPRMTGPEDVARGSSSARGSYARKNTLRTRPETGVGALLAVVAAINARPSDSPDKRETRDAETEAPVSGGSKTGFPSQWPAPTSRLPS